MHSPPRTLTRRADGRVVPAARLGELVGPDLDEALVEAAPGSNRPPAGWNFVHYDLDPQNGNVVAYLPTSVPPPPPATSFLTFLCSSAITKLPEHTVAPSENAAAFCAKESVHVPPKAPDKNSASKVPGEGF